MPNRKPKEEMPLEVLEQVELLKHPENETRWLAAAALGEIRHASAIPHLINALKDQNWAVRFNAAQALGDIGRSLQGQEVEGKEAKALQLVAEHFHEKEKPETVHKSFQAALKGKITPANVRLYIKQLRAMEGNVK